MAVEKSTVGLMDLDFNYRVFTDGSCYPNPNGFGGASAIILKKHSGKSGKGWEKIGEAVKSLFQCTNNRAELWGAIIGMNKLTQLVGPGQSVEVFSDSKYVVEGMSGRWKITTNKDLWVILRRKAQFHTAIWTWLRGHDGNHWNENCDELSNKYRLRAQKTVQVRD